MPLPSILGEVLCRVERHATEGRWSEQCAAKKKLGPIFGLAPHRLHLNWARLRTTAEGQYVVPSFWGIVFVGETDNQDVSNCHLLQSAATRDACWPSTNFFEPRQHSSYKPRAVFSKKGQRASCVTIHAQGAVQHCIRRRFVSSLSALLPWISRHRSLGQSTCQGKSTKREQHCGCRTHYRVFCISRKLCKRSIYAPE